MKNLVQCCNVNNFIETIIEKMTVVRSRCKVRKTKRKSSRKRQTRKKSRKRKLKKKVPIALSAQLAIETTKAFVKCQIASKADEIHIEDVFETLKEEGIKEKYLEANSSILRKFTKGYCASVKIECIF